MDSVPRRAVERDLLIVDMRGKKAALAAAASARGETVSAYARRMLCDSIGLVSDGPPQVAGQRARLSVRVSATDADAMRRSAAVAGLPLGQFIGAACAGGASQVAGVREAALALSTSCAELASLRRSINQLNALLRLGSVEAARPYREALDRTERAVLIHLSTASKVVAALEPFHRGTSSLPRS
jgi:uncharacterized protein (DUF1778 family)